MSDARWGDPREFGDRHRDDERPRVYDQRDREAIPLHRAGAFRRLPPARGEL